MYKDFRIAKTIIFGYMPLTPSPTPLILAEDWSDDWIPTKNVILFSLQPWGLFLTGTFSCSKKKNVEFMMEWDLGGFLG